MSVFGSRVCILAATSDFPGVSSKPGGDSKWTPTVVGLNKRDLLKEVLSVFGALLSLEPHLTSRLLTLTILAPAKSRMISSLGTEYQDILKKMSAA